MGGCEEAAELLKPARDELIRQAAQGEVVHNDDTNMRVLRIAREPSDERTGVFTSGIVSTGPGWKIAVYMTGTKHAGENLAEVLKRRAQEAGPVIQMCDALSRNIPKLTTGVEILLGNCLAHGRRQLVEVAANFPDECRYVLEMLGQVYGYDAKARELNLTPDERLQFHQAHSGPVMKQLHQWLEAQFAERKTEPNSGLGKAIKYLLRHWRALTLFLRKAGAPLDNSLVERALKRAVLHRNYVHQPITETCFVRGQGNGEESASFLRRFLHIRMDAYSTLWVEKERPCLTTQKAHRFVMRSRQRDSSTFSKYSLPNFIPKATLRQPSPSTTKGPFTSHTG